MLRSSAKYTKKQVRNVHTMYFSHL